MAKTTLQFTARVSDNRSPLQVSVSGRVETVRLLDEILKSWTMGYYEWPNGLANKVFRHSNGSSAVRVTHTGYRNYEVTVES